MFAVTKVNSSILAIIILAIIIGTKLTKKRNPLHFQRTISMNSQFYAVKTWLAADLGSGTDDDGTHDTGDTDTRTWSS